MIKYSTSQRKGKAVKQLPTFDVVTTPKEHLLNNRIILM